MAAEESSDEAPEWFERMRATNPETAAAITNLLGTFLDAGKAAPVVNAMSEEELIAASEPIRETLRLLRGTAPDKFLWFYCVPHDGNEAGGRGGV